MKYATAVTSAEFDPQNKHPPEAVEPEEHPGEWRMTGCVLVPVDHKGVELAWYWQRETEG